MSRAKIMICDDDVSMRAAFKLILSEFYELETANNGMDVVKKLKASQPDLLLLDIKMPKANGLEALREIRKVAPDLKVIVVTGYQSVEAAQEMSKLGILDYITKPFQSKRILDAVEKGLS